MKKQFKEKIADKILGEKEYIIDLSEIIIMAKSEDDAIKKVKRMIKRGDIEICNVEENR
jgi:hypothetical protein